MPGEKEFLAEPSLFYRPRVLANGIDVGSCCNLQRDALVDKSWELLLRSRYLLISSPPATGKTSLIQLIQAKYGISNYIACTNNSDPYELLLSAKVDLRNQRILYESTGNVVVALDDAQNIYWNRQFWGDLVKHAVVWFPRNLFIIISATHNLIKYSECPIELASLTRIYKAELLISEEEAEELIDLTCYKDICVKSSRTIRKAIIQQCGGVVGGVRLSVMELCEKFYDKFPTEEEVLLYLLSKPFSSLLVNRIFCMDVDPVPPIFQKFLEACFMGAAYKPVLDEKSEGVLLQLLKGGILEEVSVNAFEFSSSLAKRFYLNNIFPYRSLTVPSISSLVREAIQNMSATNLQHSIVNEEDFPREAIFPEEFMAALAAVLPPNCNICPEISKVFPSDTTEDCKKAGEIDLYINGDLRWGIGVSVMGDRISEHLDRFSKPSGKYFPLRVKDYAVVDFRRSPDGIPTNISDMEKRITVFFRPGDFTQCSCKFGMNPKVEILKLSA